MPFTFREAPESGASTSVPPTVTLKYIASGSSDRGWVKAAALSLTPPLVTTVHGFLYRQDLAIEPDGFNLFRVTVPYGRNPRADGSLRFNMSSQGGTFHVSASRETVAKYPAEAKDYKQLIGVHGDQVDGVDIVVPATRVSVTFSHPAGVLNLPYAFTIADLAGTVNSDTFLARPAGTMLFLGHDCSDGSDVAAEATYHFAYSKNLSGFSIGPISGISKQGHDYLWVAFKPAVDDGKPVHEPEAVYVERLYERIAFGPAFGFGG